MSILKRLNQRGDTLVEVLFSTVILSAVLAATFSISTASGRINRASQERTEAVKLLQDQREYMRIDPLVKSTSGFATGGCLLATPNGTELDITYVNGADCLINNRYLLSLTDTGSGPNRVFTVNASWESIVGGTDSVDLRWKNHE